MVMFSCLDGYGVGFLMHIPVPAARDAKQDHTSKQGPTSIRSFLNASAEASFLSTVVLRAAAPCQELAFFQQIIATFLIAACARPYYPGRLFQ
jgi:hypothetical protein